MSMRFRCWFFALFAVVLSGCATPVVRDNSAFMASADFSSGKVMETCGLSLPWAYQSSISLKLAAESSGSRARQAP